MAQDTRRTYSVGVIDTEQKLAAFLPKLHAASWVAVDTEADSLHAYPEKVCLIQFSTVDGDVLVDPLSKIDLDPLLDALSGHELIMHGADYDLRLLEKHHQFTPSAIFDTMLASRLIGETQFGYSTLVEKFLGVKLEKGPQKANWALRPLTERMEKYARNDTHYLKPLADKLRAGLEEKGRLAWHQESCSRLIEQCTQPEPVDMDAVWRVKGSHLLGRPGLAVLRELWRWRETEAIAANRPPFFVMSHEALVDVAAAAATQRPIEQFLPRTISERRRSGLSKAIADGLVVPVDKFPKIIERTNHRPTEAERRRFMELQKRRDVQAQALGIDPTLIASRGTLSDLARNWDRYSAELMKWQRDLLK
ncbi:MAG TPA: HRDC domain-containing protein [Verrucomicrobiae bacterium]|nr:HRDC domain-containing protein [Verrucomicrobiae bacterium]